MSSNLITMTFEIDLDVYDKASEICGLLGTSIEIMTESFIKFCVIPENLPLLEAFIKKGNAPADTGANEEVNKKIFKKVFALAMQETEKRKCMNSDT